MYNKILATGIEGKNQLTFRSYPPYLTSQFKIFLNRLRLIFKTMII